MGSTRMTAAAPPLLVALLAAGCTEFDLQALHLAAGTGDVGARLIGAEAREVSAPRYGVSPQAFSNPHLGVNAAGQYLVAYQDRRGDDSGWRAGDNVRLARIAPDGTLRDRGGIELELSGPSRGQTAVASDGSDYLVVWIEQTDYEESKVVFARLGADGRPLQAPTELRAAADVEHSAPRACFDGVHYNLVFSAFDNVAWSGELFAARIDAQGSVVGVSELPTAADKSPSRAGIACDAQGSLLGWSESDGSAAEVRVLAWPKQQPLPATSSALSLPGVSQTGWISLASGGGSFLAVWEEARGASAPKRLVGQLLSASGARTATADIVLGAPQAGSRFPRLRFDGTDFRLLTQQLVANQEQTFITTIDTAGAITGPTTALTSGDRHYPGDLACHAGACLVAWTTGPALEYFAEAARVSAGNQLLDDPARPVATPSDEQTGLRLVADGSQVLFAWFGAEGRDPFRLYLRRQDLAGNWLDAAPSAVIPGRDVPLTVLLATALPGGGFALAYSLPDPQSSSTHRELRLSFVSAAGQVSSAAPFSSYSHEDMTHLTCTSSECLVLVWDYFETYAYRLDHQGNLVGSGRQVFGCAGNLTAIDDAYWCSAPTSDPSGLRITRFDATLAAVGTPLAIPLPGEDVGGAVVLPDATGVTLAYSSASTAGVKLWAARVNATADAILAGPSELVRYHATSYSAGDLVPLQLVAAGSETFLFWRATDGQPVYRLRLQRLSQVGSSLSLVGDLDELVPEAPGLATPQAVGTPAGELLLAYLERDSDPDRGSHRIKVRHSAGAQASDGGITPPADGGVITPDAASADGTTTGDAAPAGDGASLADTGADAGADAGMLSDAGVLPGDSGVPDADAGGPSRDGAIARDAAAATDDGGGGCSCELGARGVPGTGCTLLLLLLGALLGRRKEDQ